MLIQTVASPVPKPTPAAAVKLSALGCRGLSRVDMMMDSNGDLFALEVNTLPGMTVNSLLPKAALAAGITFPELLDRLVQLALDPEA